MPVRELLSVDDNDGAKSLSCRNILAKQLSNAVFVVPSWIVLHRLGCNSLCRKSVLARGRIYLRKLPSRT